MSKIFMYSNDNPVIVSLNLLHAKFVLDLQALQLDPHQRLVCLKHRYESLKAPLSQLVAIQVEQVDRMAGFQVLKD